MQARFPSGSNSPNTIAKDGEEGPLLRVFFRAEVLGAKVATIALSCLSASLLAITPTRNQKQASSVLPQYFFPNSRVTLPLWFAGLSKNRATELACAATPSVWMVGGASAGWQAPPRMGPVDDLRL